MKDSACQKANIEMLAQQFVAGSYQSSRTDNKNYQFPFGAIELPWYFYKESKTTHYQFSRRTHRSLLRVAIHKKVTKRNFTNRRKKEFSTHLTSNSTEPKIINKDRSFPSREWMVIL